MLQRHLSRRAHQVPLLFLLCWCLGLGAGCTSCDGAISAANDGTPGGDAGVADGDAGCVGPLCVVPGDGGGMLPGRMIVSVRLEPAAASLVSTASQPQPTQRFSLVARFDDGTEGPYAGPVTYAIDDDTIGWIDGANGTFTANGAVGGRAEVTATVAGLAPAVGSLDVNLERLVIEPGAPADSASRFGQPVEDLARTAGVVYPLDGVVMPQNVYPADVQWTRSAVGDIFRITLRKPHAQVTGYVQAVDGGFGDHWLIDEEGWRAVAQSDPQEPATLTVDRWEAASGEAIAGVPRQLRFAQAALSGSVYYWDISATRIVRIDGGSVTRDHFMPDPPASRGGGQNCVGCHAVSNSGRYMVGRLGPGNNIGTVFDLTKDLTQKPVPTEFALRDDGPHFWFSTWSHDDTRLIVTMGEDGAGNGRLELMDPFTGQVLTPTTGALPSNGVTQPAWSPDGTLVAYVSGANNWGGEMTAGDISVLPSMGGDAFGTPQLIRPGSPFPGEAPAGAANSYPTWSPDSQWLAFAHGTGSRSERDSAALYMMRRDGSELVRLDRANGGAMTDDNFQPNFAPFDQGEYVWLSFLSRRDYGNSKVGTAGAARQQIWVTAIKKNAAPGEDPSQVAYWLPGQDTQSMNIAAFWAPRACRDQGEGCAVGSECCSGQCSPGPDGAKICSPPPPDRCHELNESCGGDADCCGDLICVDRACFRLIE